MAEKSSLYRPITISRPIFCFMKLGISQIAFKNLSLIAFLKKLESLPIQGLELAPTLIWREPVESSSSERREVRNLITSANKSVIGLQSVLFGQPRMQLFGSESSRQSCLDYLKRMLELTRDLGGTQISFGAFKNRCRGHLEMQKALEIAEVFFRRLASTAQELGVVVCLEPISAAFGCDFIVTAEEASDLVERVSHSSFRLLLDTGCIVTNKEHVQNVFIRYAHLLHHVQVNDPELTPPGSGGTNHGEIANVLKQIGYNRWVTIECFLANADSTEELAYAVECYGDHEPVSKRASR